MVWPGSRLSVSVGTPCRCGSDGVVKKGPALLGGYKGVSPCSFSSLFSLSREKRARVMRFSWKSVRTLWARPRQCMVRTPGPGVGVTWSTWTDAGTALRYNGSEGCEVAREQEPTPMPSRYTCGGRCGRIQRMGMFAVGRVARANPEARGRFMVWRPGVPRRVVGAGALAFRFNTRENWPGLEVICGNI